VGTGEVVEMVYLYLRFTIDELRLEIQTYDVTIYDLRITIRNTDLRCDNLRFSDLPFNDIAMLHRNDKHWLR